MERNRLDTPIRCIPSETHCLGVHFSLNITDALIVSLLHNKHWLHWKMWLANTPIIDVMPLELRCCKLLQIGAAFPSRWILTLMDYSYCVNLAATNCFFSLFCIFVYSHSFQDWSKTVRSLIIIFTAIVLTLRNKNKSYINTFYIVSFQNVLKVALEKYSF